MFALGRGAHAGLGALKIGMGVGKHAGIGGLLGGAGSLFKNALDDDGDRFDLRDTAGDIGQGALIGGAMGGVGAKLAGRFLPGRLGAASSTGLKGAGMLGALFQDYEPADPSPMADVGAPGVMGSPAGSLTGASTAGGLGINLLDMFDGAGIGSPPNGPTMTLADYMDNPRLNGQVDGLLAQELNPLGRQVKQIQREREIGLQSNESLGQDLQNQMGQIARDNAQQTRSIQESADKSAMRADEEADKAAAQAQLGLAGNDFTRQAVAENQAELDAQLADRRMADAELLERLGVSTSNALGEIAAAEVQQTGQNAIKIRTDASDAITETRGKIADVRAKRPTLLGQLAQGAFDSSIQKHQTNLSTWEAKLKAATSRADMAKNQLMIESDMAAAQAEAQGAPMGFKPEHYLKPSGMSIPNENTGDPMAIPVYATFPYEQLPPGLIPPETWKMWNDAYETALAGQ